MRLTRNFTRAEFTCSCGCGFNTVDYELVNILQVVRDHFKKPIAITSGCRCARHNRKVGGSENSLHRIGRAADFKVIGVEPEEVYKALDQYLKNRCGLGLYKSWVHVDTRSGKAARWRG